MALEKLSKYLVHQYVRWVKTPRKTQKAVLTSLQQEYKQRKSFLPLFLSRMFSARVLVPLLPGLAVAMLFFFLVSARVGPSYEMTAHTAGNDIINRSLKNFSLLRSGKLMPSMVSMGSENVREFLQRSNLPFEVHVPHLDGCEWCGAATSEGSGIRQAHVVYKIGPELLYVFELSNDDALSGERLSLPPAAKRGLVQSGWYTDPDHPECSVVLWKTDETVCVAVSTMKKGRLLSLLTAR